MSELLYTRDHEWLRIEAGGEVTVGITDYAQEQLGDVVYVELPAVGQAIEPGVNLVVIESVKAVGEVKLPLAGTVSAVNPRLADEPELINRAPLAEGWLLRLRPAAPLDPSTWLDATAYAAFVAGL
jgi:glycine cleavage system H protein